MVPPIFAGIAGAMGLSRIIYSASGIAKTTYLTPSQIFASGLKSPLFQGGGFGLGYTGGAYGGYGVSNTWDPLGVHRPKYKQASQTLGIMPYGRRYYGRRSYYSRYGRRYRRRRFRSTYRRSWRGYY